METTQQKPEWGAATRWLFRFAFCYFPLYALCCGNATPWKPLPFIGDHLELLFWWPFKHAAPWFGTHWFHLTGSSARLHQGVATDQALTYISTGLMFILALVATVVWSWLDRGRKSYSELLLWLRFTLRLCIGAAMIIYGMLKFFPSQMGPPSLAVLNEPVGAMSPMTLLWTLLGMNPGYEILAGAIETLCGLLVLFRRTALLGAIATAFVVSNVVLYNYFFDVPVKLYSAHLLLMTLVVIAPDLQRLYRFFWEHLPAAASLDWSPWSSPRALRLETALVALGATMALATQVQHLAPRLALMRSNTAHPNPLTGLWRVDAATQPYITADGLPMKELCLEPNGRVMMRASDDVLWRALETYDGSAHTLLIQPIGVTEPTLYRFAQPDPAHLVLTPLSGQTGVLTLSRIPTPSSYPLLTRGFHWVNEWGLER